MALKLNPDIDRKAVAQELREQGRVQIENALAGETAHEVHRWLVEKTPWSFSYYDGERAAIIPAEDARHLGPQDWATIQRQVFALARDRFTYAYHLYTLGKLPPLHRSNQAVERFFDFLNSLEMLSFIQEILDEPSIRGADAQASRFGPGQFLARHNDLAPNVPRRLAYVFNFTPDWRADWGGYLLFPDDAGNAEAAWMPRFNTLNLFLVPQDHLVSLISPFAGDYRYAISGWYHV